MRLVHDYFYGHKISDYGVRNGYLDYGTLVKAFDAVLNNTIISYDIDGWELVSGSNDDLIEEYNNDIEELEMELEGLDPKSKEYEEVEDKIDDIQHERDRLNLHPEVFQWYIVSGRGVEILTEINEIVYYNSNLDINLWGVAHLNESWSHVLTSVPCNCGYEEV